MTATLMGIMYTIFLSFHMILIDQNEHRLLICALCRLRHSAPNIRIFHGACFGKA